MKKFLVATFLTVILCGCTPVQLAWFSEADDYDRREVNKAVIILAAEEFGVDPDLMLAIARCESGYDTLAKNKKSTASGLFQFLDFTWESNRTRLGVEYEIWQVFDPIAASRTAADMIANGSRAWAESEKCWSR